MRYLLVVLLFPMLMVARVSHGDTAVPETRFITFSEALSHALANSPKLAAASHLTDADAARAEARDGFPNPELSVEMEDFLGSGVADGVDSLQVTTALSQDIPIGGTPGARREAHTAQKAVSTLEYQLVKQALVADVAGAFLDLLAAQRRLENAAEMAVLAGETVETIQAQVDAGRATPIEVDKATIVYKLALLDRESAARRLTISRRRLAAVCGETAPFFERVEGSLDHIVPLPDPARLEADLEAHPLLRTEAARRRHQEAVLSLEKARRIPDLSVRLGYRYMNATSDSAMVAGLAIPLPFVDRNKGNIGAQTHMVRNAEQTEEDARVSLHLALGEAYQLLAAEHNRASVLKTEVYPTVQSTFEAVAEGYRIGRFGYLDLLDAQRTLFEVKRQTLEALIAYQQTVIHLNRIAAQPVSPNHFASTAPEGGAPQ